jgi:hypothetical protein
MKVCNGAKGEAGIGWVEVCSLPQEQLDEETTQVSGELVKFDRLPFPKNPMVREL